RLKAKDIVNMIRRQPEKNIPGWLRGAFVARGDRIVVKDIELTPGMQSSEWLPVFKCLLWASQSGEWNVTSGTVWGRPEGKTNLAPYLRLGATRPGFPEQGGGWRERDLEDHVGHTVASAARLEELAKKRGWPVHPKELRMPGKTGLAIVGVARANWDREM